jgi:3-methyladenine DNA glycosylase AlkD
MPDLTYLEPLLRQYEDNRDAARAIQMKKYMKGQFDFFGMGTPARRAMMTAHIRKYGLPDRNKVEEITHYLWKKDERECQFTAIDLLNRMKRYLDQDNFPLMEYMITTKSWWDTVDGTAGWLVAEIMKKNPDRVRPVTSLWMDSGNIWLQRSCLLFQLHYKQDTDLDLLFEFIGKLSGHNSFWIRKAIGWVLREYSKTDPHTVQAYVDTHPELSGLSKREALKVIHRKNRPGPA